jgi:hypothetical protein
LKDSASHRAAADAEDAEAVVEDAGAEVDAEEDADERSVRLVERSFGDIFLQFVGRHSTPLQSRWDPMPTGNMETNFGGGNPYSIRRLNKFIYFCRESPPMMPSHRSIPSKLAYSENTKTKNSWWFAPQQMMPKMEQPLPTKCISAPAVMDTAMWWRNVSGAKQSHWADKFMKMKRKWQTNT